MPQGGRGDGGGDRDEQETEDQLDQGLREGAPDRHLVIAKFGDGQPHEDRGNEAGVVADDVTRRRDADHCGQHGGCAERSLEAQLAVQQPQQTRSDDAPGDPDPDTQDKLRDLGRGALMSTGDDRVEHQGAENAADRIDQRTFPGKNPLDPFHRPEQLEQRAHDRRAGHHENRPEHQRGRARHAQQRCGGERGKPPRDRHADRDQPDHRSTGMPTQFAQVQADAGVEQDQRHRQRHQRLERRAQQAVGVDGIGHRAGRETHR
jgi:hypothetical protein